MRIEELTTKSILMLHDAVREALKADDLQTEGTKEYGVREFSDWQEWADRLEAELDKRKEDYKRIKW